MNGFQKIILCLFLFIECFGKQIRPLTDEIYHQRLLTQLNNTHFFIVVTSGKHAIHDEIIQYIENFTPDHKIEIYECDMDNNKQICPADAPIMLIINTIKINYNGRHKNKEDLEKWVRFRVTEYPERLHSLEDLKAHARDKNQVFCFIDRQGEAITKKEYIFIATAKKLHFLYFCSLDVQIGKQLRLKEGHLVMIRKDLSYQFDFWSENVDEDSEHLHQIWVNFLISRCQNQFRIENRDKSHDLATFQCDLSLECEEQMMEILHYELIWRTKHPQINFNIKILHTTTGQMKTGRKKKLDLPIIKFGKTTVSKIIEHQQSTGAVLQQTLYQRDVYMQKDPIINENTIDILLKDYQNKKLEFVIRDTETDIRTLDGQEGKYHRELKQKEKQKAVDEVQL